MMPANTVPPAEFEFGGRACEEYVKKDMACVEAKVPVAVREQMRVSFDQARTAWRQAASTPEGRASLAQACSIANEAAKAGMAAYGCAF